MTRRLNSSGSRKRGLPQIRWTDNVIPNCPTEQLGEKRQRKQTSPLNGNNNAERREIMYRNIFTFHERNARHIYLHRSHRAKSDLQYLMKYDYGFP